MLVAAWVAAAVIAGLLAYHIMKADSAEPSHNGAPQGFTLAAVQADIENRFTRIEHISAAEMTALPATDLLIFDTRPAAEYAVSHIENAYRIDPDMRAAAFSTQFGAAAQDKILIFYCSVGVRSSQLAEALLDDLPGARGIYNLRGGLFGWHNEGRALVNAAGPTRAIHPFDNKWGQLIRGQSWLSYE